MIPTLGPKIFGKFVRRGLKQVVAQKVLPESPALRQVRSPLLLKSMSSHAVVAVASGLALRLSRGPRHDPHLAVPALRVEPPQQILDGSVLA